MISEWHRGLIEKPIDKRGKVNRHKPIVVNESEVEKIKELMLDGWSFNVAFSKATGLSSSAKIQIEIRNRPDVAPMIREQLERRQRWALGGFR